MERVRGEMLLILYVTEAGEAWGPLEGEPILGISSFTSKRLLLPQVGSGLEEREDVMPEIWPQQE